MSYSVLIDHDVITLLYVLFGFVIAIDLIFWIRMNLLSLLRWSTLG